MVFDDVIDEEIARSQVQLEDALEWLSQTAFSRQAPGCRMIHICTRWCQHDFADYCLQKGWVPIRYWVMWWWALGVAMVAFYVVLTPIWLGLRAAAWMAELRSRLR